MLSPTRIGAISSVGETPRILVEYKYQGVGPLYHRNIELRKLEPKASVEKISKLLVSKHGDLFGLVEFSQILGVVGRLMETFKEKFDKEKERETEEQKQKNIPAPTPAPAVTGTMNYGDDDSDSYESDDSFEEEEIEEIEELEKVEENEAPTLPTPAPTVIPTVALIEQKNNNKLDSLLAAKKNKINPKVANPNKKYLSSFGDLNKVSEEELIKAKDQMSDAFEQNRAKPGDEEYEYDVRMDFEDGDEESSWD